MGAAASRLAMARQPRTEASCLAMARQPRTEASCLAMARQPRTEASCLAMAHREDQICYTFCMDTSHYRRFHDYDYSRGASLFITISTEPRRPCFGAVVNAQLVHTPLGKAVCEALENFPLFHPGFTIHGYVVMPDHVHFNLRIEPGMADPLKRLGLAIRGFKRYTTALALRDGAIAQQDASVRGCAQQEASGGRAQQEASILPCDGSSHGSLWQAGYHDHICVSRAFIEAVQRYMAGNPLKWEMQHNQPAFLRIREPLLSPRLDPGAYWRGVGNVSLLEAGRKIVSVRVSRRCGAAEHAEALRRLSVAINKGYALLSGFTSPGEHEVRDMALARPDAKLIVALPSRLAYGYKPDSRFLKPLFEGRCLIIAQGIEEVDFGRAACLDLNAEIAAIAKAGEGYATYWRPGAEPWI